MRVPAIAEVGPEEASGKSWILENGFDEPVAEMTAAEELLRRPTAGNLELASAQLAALVDRAQRNESCRAAVARERERLARLGELLDSAWRIRLGLARFTEAGRSGYQADGRLTEASIPGQQASVTG